MVWWPLGPWQYQLPPLPPPPLRSTTYFSQCINLSRILANLINQEMQKYPRNTNKHFHSGIVFPKHSTLCPDYTIIQSRPPLRSEPELLQFTFLTRFCSRFWMLASLRLRNILRVVGCQCSSDYNNNNNDDTGCCNLAFFNKIKQIRMRKAAAQSWWGNQHRNNEKRREGNTSSIRRVNIIDCMEGGGG